MTGIPAQLWVQQQITQIEAHCRTASARIAQARDMRTVVQATHISVRPELRAISKTIPGLRRVKDDAVAKLNKLLDSHLDEIRKAESQAAAEKIAGRYRMRDWDNLRGWYAQVYVRADSESKRIIRRKWLNPEES